MSYTATTGPSKTTTTTSTTPTSADKIRCRCGHLAKRLTSQSEKNPGRVFYQCYKGRDDVTNCKFFLWEDMAHGKEGPATESPGKAAAAAASVARYNASLAAKASPIPKAGNYSKAFGGTTSGYSYATSPLKPISSIPHPPRPIQRLGSGSSNSLDIPATPDEVSEVPASQIPDLTIGAGWNSARKRAMAKKRREVMRRALEGRTSDDSSTDDEEEDEEIVGDAVRSDAEVEVIEAYEPVNAGGRRADVKERSDDFDSDGIAWGQVDVDAIEASASQQAAQTPRNLRAADATALGTASRDHPTRSGMSARATFMDKLKAVELAGSPNDDGPTPKKRKRDDQEDETMLRGPHSASTMTDGATTPSFVSACRTLTPPETERRSDLAGFSSMADGPGTQAAVQSAGVSSSIAAGGNASIHPLLEALNKDLLRRDRRAAADEKSREMLRGRVKALEGRVRELEAELRKAKSERRA